MDIIHCTKNYHRFKIDELFALANEVQNGIYTNLNIFGNPPLSENDFSDLKNNFKTAHASYATYGVTQQTNFKNSQQRLLQALDELGSYVTKLADNDVSIIALSGFASSKSKRNKKKAPQKALTCKIKRSETQGELFLEIEAEDDSRNQFYFFICSEGKELKKPSFAKGTLLIEESDHRVFYNYTKSRKKTINGLTPGTYYYIYVFVCNAHGVSPLSEPIKVMAT